MTYLLPADFREDTLNEACYQRELNEGEAPDAALTAAIARQTARFDSWTQDHFEPTTGAVDVDGHGGLRLYLPARYSAVTSVKTRDAFGTLSSAVDVSAYRLHSSLNAAGTDRRTPNAILDWLELVPGSVGLPLGGWYWPTDSKAVEVTGTYGWAAPPGDVKMAVAWLVWDHFKTIRPNLRTAEQLSTGGAITRFVTPDPANGIFSGIGMVDEIVARYSRRVTVAVR